MPLLELRHVSKSYREPGTDLVVPVLKDISLSIDPGDSLAIVGPSGCGKSTLLNILGTLDEPDSGEFLFEGESVQGSTVQRLAALRSEKFGFIFQLHHLLPQCTVLENVLLPTLALAQRPDPTATKARAIELLNTVGLGPRVTWKPAQLSGGERQRVAFARALINQPRIILADEPTGALDETNADSLTELMVNLVDKFGISLVLVSHNPKQAERMRRILHIHEGTIASSAKP
jgi:lipoprotein-releasing system ATP-binding protein